MSPELRFSAVRLVECMHADTARLVLCSGTKMYGQDGDKCGCVVSSGSAFVFVIIHNLSCSPRYWMCVPGYMIRPSSAWSPKAGY